MKITFILEKKNGSNEIKTMEIEPSKAVEELDALLKSGDYKSGAFRKVRN